MFEQVTDSAAADENELVEFRAALWDEPVRDEDLLDPDDPVWIERERVAHALWEQEYGTAEGSLARIARSRADSARSSGSELRAIADFISVRAREVALAVAAEAREGGTRDEIEATVRAAEESAAAELALWMHISAGGADRRIEFACGLARRLPLTLNALESGAITERLAEILWSETRELDLAKAAWVERQTLPKAHTATPAAFRRLVRRRVEQADVDAVLKRRAAALAQRRVSLTPAGDGMAWISALLPAEDALAVFGVIDACAHQRVPGDERSLDNRHADTLVDLVTRPGNQDPRVGYVVHMHAGSSSGSSGSGSAGTEPPTEPPTEDRLATVQGGEQIPTQRAREKADLTVHHPAVPVDIAAILADYNSRPDIYKPSAKLKRAIRARDKHCRFPGCRRPAHRCELDHTIAYEVGGRTVYFNLSALCKHHHRIKHMPGWRCTQDDRGVLTWTTPSGQVYITRPPPPVGDEHPDYEQPPPPRPPREAAVDDPPPF